MKAYNRLHHLPILLPIVFRDDFDVKLLSTRGNTADADVNDEAVRLKDIKLKQTLLNRLLKDCIVSIDTYEVGLEDKSYMFNVISNLVLISCD